MSSSNYFQLGHLPKWYLVAAFHFGTDADCIQRDRLPNAHLAKAHTYSKQAAHDIAGHIRAHSQNVCRHGSWSGVSHTRSPGLHKDSVIQNSAGRSFLEILMRGKALSAFVSELGGAFWHSWFLLAGIWSWLISNMSRPPTRWPPGWSKNLS